MIYKFLNIPCIAQLYLYHMVKFHGRHFGYDITQLGKPLCSELLYQLKNGIALRTQNSILEMLQLLIKCLLLTI